MVEKNIPYSAGEIAAEKKLLRRELVGMLSAMPEAERKEADERIRRLAADMPQYQQAGQLFIFVGVGWEVDTRPLIEDALAAGKQVAIPRCAPMTASGAAHSTASATAPEAMLGVMEACLIRSLDDLQPVPPLGLWEPLAGAPVLPPADIDFALIPCIACDKAGYRLGRGGGYYDRFLNEGRFVKATVCRKALLRDTLPAEAHDERVDFAITETGLYVFDNKG